MGLSLRFIIPLACVIGLVAFGVAPLVDHLTYKWFVRDVDVRSQLITSTLREPLFPAIDEGSKAQVLRIFHRATQDERLYALGFCDLRHHLIYQTEMFPDQVSCRSPAELSQIPENIGSGSSSYRVSFHPLADEGRNLGELVIVHDLSFIQSRRNDIKLYLIYLFVLLAVVVSLITVVVAKLSWQEWLWGIRSIVRNGLARPLSQITSPELRPIVKDLRHLIRELESSQRSRDENQVSWTPKALKNILNKELSGDEVLIVSNREPYIHVKKR